MADIPYKPHHEGPMFPEDAEGIADEFASYLMLSDAVVGAEVADQNRKDKARASFKVWPW